MESLFSFCLLFFAIGRSHLLSVELGGQKVLLSPLPSMYIAFVGVPLRQIASWLSKIWLFAFFTLDETFDPRGYCW